MLRLINEHRSVALAIPRFGNRKHGLILEPSSTKEIKISFEESKQNAEEIMHQATDAVIAARISIMPEVNGATVTLRFMLSG